MFELHFETALAHRATPEHISISLREISERGMIDLRGFSTDKKFMAATKSVLGFDLPKAPRTSASWGDIKALWLSPDQWLILCTRSKCAELLSDLQKALGKVHSLAVNVSDMRSILRMEGACVRETLMKGSTLDLISADYKPGTVRRMRFAEIAALLHVVEENVIDIYVFRSYANYAWDFIVKSARKGSEVRLFSK
jgi:sarcosine oxidase, subunit gamma